MSADQWYYTDAQGQQQGPYSLDQMREFATQGYLKPETLVWHEGMAEWTGALASGQIYAAAAPQAAPAGFSVSPQMGTAAAGGEYPIPSVKKTSFGLWMGLYLIAVALVVISFLTFAASAPETPDFTEVNQQMQAAETQEEMEQAEAAMQAQINEMNQELSSTEAAGIGLGLVMLLGAWVLSIIAAIYSYIILYRAWLILQPGGARTSPGQAVGFMFIPFFNLYWIFNVYVGWATDWNRIRASYSNLTAAPMASRGMFIAAFVCIFTILLSPIGLILLLVGKKQMCDTINFMVSQRMMSATTTGGNLPKLF